MPCYWKRLYPRLLPTFSVVVRYNPVWAIHEFGDDHLVVYEWDGW